MKTTTTWLSAAILALAAATALAQDKQGSIEGLEKRIERLEKSVERLERAISRLESQSSERGGSRGGMMGDGGMMGGGMMGGGMMGRSRPNEQWRTPEGGR